MKNISKLIDNTYAHRGIFDNKEIPENSIGSFKQALEYNYNIELDVRLTKDKKIVVFHDDNLSRLCGVNKLVSECSYNEIKQYKLLNTKYIIPLLVDVLSIVNGKVNLLIETKSKKYSNNLEKELSKLLDDYKGTFAIQSFNFLSIKWFKKNRKNYIVGVLASNFKNKRINIFYKLISKTLLFDIVLKVDFISFDIKSLPNKYLNKKRNKKPILGWTFKSLEDVEKSKYCDCIIAEKKILLK